MGWDGMEWVDIVGDANNCGEVGGVAVEGAVDSCGFSSYLEGYAWWSGWGVGAWGVDSMILRSDLHPGSK